MLTNGLSSAIVSFMRMGEDEFREKEAKALDGKITINNVYQWVKENKINPEQMAILIGFCSYVKNEKSENKR